MAYHHQSSKTLLLLLFLWKVWNPLYNPTKAVRSQVRILAYLTYRMTNLATVHTADSTGLPQTRSMWEFSISFSYLIQFLPTNSHFLTYLPYLSCIIHYAHSIVSFISMICLMTAWNIWDSWWTDNLYLHKMFQTKHICRIYEAEYVFLQNK